MSSRDWSRVLQLLQDAIDEPNAAMQLLQQIANESPQFLHREGYHPSMRPYAQKLIDCCNDTKTDLSDPLQLAGLALSTALDAINYIAHLTDKVVAQGKALKDIADTLKNIDRGEGNG